ncbi:AbrB family transcriptional regulator [Niveispirillum irakense]|uniref:AbrB family transcriptional regulator n=1 Tax=Niveispirillum irakense TaxID=34011 RepID=UPI000412E60F|nr:AbrB family transcriptional regulator [Niveispirillum irakense]
MSALVKGGQWLILVLATAVMVPGLKLVGVPAALLLGPLLVGIACGLAGFAIRPPKIALLCSYTMVGCLVAVALGSAVGPAMLAQLPVLLAIGGATLLASAGLGWVLARLGWFSGATAIWGLSPGGAAGMVALAQEQGGDGRMVAVIQYLRILMVTGSAIALAHMLTGPVPTPPMASWFPPLQMPGLLETMGLAALGVVVARLFRFPAGAFLVPGLAGAALIAAGLTRPSVPPLLAAAAYGFIGWNIGLSFTRSTLADCARALPRILAACLLLIGLCAGLGALVSLLCDVDWLTGYLATTPGGIDAILIIGATVPVDLPFILSAQVLRVLLVLLCGPALATYVARQVT